MTTPNDSLPAVGLTGLFGLVLHPDYIGCPLVTATAVHRNGAWMCRLYGSSRLAEHKTKEDAASWIRKWGNADLIIEAIECPPNASAMASPPLTPQDTDHE